MPRKSSASAPATVAAFQVTPPSVVASQVPPLPLANTVRASPALTPRSDANRLTRNTELTRYGPLTPTFHQDRSTYTTINLHEIHPSGVPRKLPSRQLQAETRSGGGLLLLRRRIPLARHSVVYFCSGAYMLGRVLRLRSARLRST